MPLDVSVPVTREGNYDVTHIESVLRRLGLEGISAFFAVARGYAEAFAIDADLLADRGASEYAVLSADPEGLAVLDHLLSTDVDGSLLAVIYQHLVGRGFRSTSGKFFTPMSVARSMASLLPVTPEAVVMDPSCGGGTFLLEASRRWGLTPCSLLGNDVEPSLAVLTALTLAIRASNRQRHVFAENMFYPSSDLSSRFGTIDAMLANPPFSLRISVGGFTSPLVAAGYSNSDAVFLDLAWSLLRPGGRLVCLLPQSLIANSDFERMRWEVESRWALRAVIGLPEGIFYTTAATSTRADIVVLDKRSDADPTGHVLFAHASSAGIGLNARDRAPEDDLGRLVADPEVRCALDLDIASLG